VYSHDLSVYECPPSTPPTSACVSISLGGLGNVRRPYDQPTRLEKLFSFVPSCRWVERDSHGGREHRCSQVFGVVPRHLPRLSGGVVLRDVAIGLRRGDRQTHRGSDDALALPGRRERTRRPSGWWTCPTLCPPRASFRRSGQSTERRHLCHGRCILDNFSHNSLGSQRGDSSPSSFQ
jgi:hypothetical protein